ncbi:hypothetical protein ACIO3R_12300 [Streptomyces sp. NPDC087428]|uniref:hypothetical protein n=1 Tax=Streptomyces sp. NPDC087428 TaxID=3365788 RepID=UPI0038114D38
MAHGHREAGAAAVVAGVGPAVVAVRVRLPVQADAPVTGLDAARAAGLRARTRPTRATWVGRRP